MLYDLPETAKLLLNDAWGIYVPNECAQRFKLENILMEDLKILKSGPEAEYYWDAWEDVLDQAILKIDGQDHYLWQDGDLWAIPVDAEWPGVY